MTVGTQVRHTDFPEWFGQVAVIGEDTGLGPYHEVQVQWAHKDGKPTGHHLFEIRPETFAEYLFTRKGSFGKWPNVVAWWAHIMLVGVAFSAWWAAPPILAAIYIGHYLQFRGIFK